MKFYRLPMSTIKNIPNYFDPLNPKETYKTSSELGNYHWYFFSQKIAGVEALENNTEFSLRQFEKVPILNLEDSQSIPFGEFHKFLVKNYMGWAPYAKGMDEERAVRYADKLVESFLSCKPENALYIKYGSTVDIKEVCAELEDHDIPIFVNGIFGVVDLENMEYFKLVFGTYDEYNEKCIFSSSLKNISNINFCPIRKIPIKFNAIDPVLNNEGYINELGNYEWFLYQYRVKDNNLDTGKIKNDVTFRNKLNPVGQFENSQLISFGEFHKFLVKNYMGWAPYAKGMDEERAVRYADKLVESFLSCKPENALYIKYEGWKDIDDPYLINGVVCIFDEDNNEFFELVMGGTD